MEWSNKLRYLFEENRESGQTVIGKCLFSRGFAPTAGGHSHRSFDLRCNGLTTNHPDQRTGQLNDIRLDGSFRRPLYDITDTERSLFSLFLRTTEHTGEEDRNDGLNTLWPAETRNGSSWRTNTFNGPTKGYDEFLEIFLWYLLDERVECDPGCFHDLLAAIIEEGDELADPIGAVIRCVEVVILNLAEYAEYFASGGTSACVVVLGPVDGEKRVSVGRQLS